jgi:hypothetical protein
MLMKLEFSQRMFERYSKINFVKICPEGTELFHMDRQTDETKLIVMFSNFTNVSKGTSDQVRTEGKMVMALQENRIGGVGTEESDQILSKNSR